MSNIAAEATARALQYGPTEGLREVKQCIVDVMGTEGMRVDPDDVLVTTGGQQVIDLMCKTFIDPGDVIVAEAPTYPGAVPSFCAYQADVVQVSMDSDGMRIDELESTLDQLEREGRRPKFIYTVPTFQNPAGVTMSLERRRRLVDIAHQRELLVLEDNPYSLLRYEGDPVPTLRRSTAGSSWSTSARSRRSCRPASAWAGRVAPAPVIDKMNLGKQGVDLCSSTMTQLFVAEYFEQNRWLDYVRLAARASTAAGATRCSTRSPSTSRARPSGPYPQGGMFLWATLPDYIDTTDLLARALSENVAFVPGRAAYVDGRGGLFACD